MGWYIATTRARLFRSCGFERTDMSPWMQDAEKTGLLRLLESREHSAASREEFLRTKMRLEAIEAQTRAAIAEERAAAALELAVVVVDVSCVAVSVTLPDAGSEFVPSRPMLAVVMTLIETAAAT